MNLKYVKYIVDAAIVAITLYLATVIFYGKPINPLQFLSNQSNSLMLGNMYNTDIFLIRDVPTRADSESRKPRDKNKKYDENSPQIEQQTVPDTKKGTSTLQSVVPPAPEVKKETTVPAVTGPAVTKLKTPGFEVQISEGVSWSTVAKMLCIVLLGYLGIKMTNVVYNKLNRHYISKNIKH